MPASSFPESELSFPRPLARSDLPIVGGIGNAHRLAEPSFRIARCGRSSSRMDEIRGRRKGSALRGGARCRTSAARGRNATGVLTMKRIVCDGFFVSSARCSLVVMIRGMRSRIMTARRRVVQLAMTDEDLSRLMATARSRSEPASRVERARMLLAYRDDPSFFAVGQALGVHHQTVQRCIARAVAYGAIAALDDRPRPGKEPTITAEARAWLVSLACRKAKDLGYPHELWTTRLLARHARDHGPRRGTPA